MIGSRLCIQPITAVTSLTADHTNAATSRSVSHSISFDFSPIHLPLLRSRRFRFPKPKSFLISCNSSPIRSTPGDHHHNNNDTDFLEASLLLSETITHYGMWRHRFQDDLQWKSPISSFPQHTSRTDSSLLRQDLLQTFQNPTIFLKISCDGDYVLPIVVGKVAIEKLIDAEVEEESEDFPDQFQFVKNLVERLDHEVVMVRITERVVSTYFARLYLSQPRKSDIISVDLRPSDAINVANKCKKALVISAGLVLFQQITGQPSALYYRIRQLHLHVALTTHCSATTPHGSPLRSSRPSLRLNRTPSSPLVPRIKRSAHTFPPITHRPHHLHFSLFSATSNIRLPSSLIVNNTSPQCVSFGFRNLLWNLCCRAFTANSSAVSTQQIVSSL